MRMRERFGESVTWAGLADAATAGVGAVEIAAHELVDFTELMHALAGPGAAAVLDPFEHVSVHGPIDVEPNGWARIAIEAGGLPPAVCHLLVHPDVIDSSGLAALATLGARLCVENMDASKAHGRDARELQRTFRRCPDAGFCLDVAHAWTCDPTLALGHELLDAFSGRLRQVHVSGIEPDGSHRPTTRADFDRYVPLLKRCRDVPWILEQPLTGD
jgi:sugar phosphate isomerase/epimerase